MLCCALSVPVLQPLLSISVPGVLPFIGDVMELHCEDKRASPPVLYWFYHENITLGNVSAPFGGKASFKLSLTAGHSGNYFCEAGNGWGTKRSEVLTLNVTGRTTERPIPGRNLHYAKPWLSSFPCAIPPFRKSELHWSSRPAMLFTVSAAVCPLCLLLL